MGSWDCKHFYQLNYLPAPIYVLRHSLTTSQADLELCVAEDNLELLGPPTSTSQVLDYNPA